MSLNRTKLFVSCHHEVTVPNNTLLVPIQVGAALTDKRFPGFLYDNTGDNISHLNRSYCELTAQYWAWKNADLDYYGFFHYRRYLYPGVRVSNPYRVEYCATSSVLQKLHYDRFESLIALYDIILPIGEDMHMSVYDHYSLGKHQHQEDLELVWTIVAERYPEYANAMSEYFSGTICYFGNIFIMKRPLFFEYCEWLFSILAEFDRRSHTEHYSPQEKRVDGYLAERLLGVYITYQKSVNPLQIAELPRVHFTFNMREYLMKNFCNLLLPPGTKRRSVVKSLSRRR